MTAAANNAPPVCRARSEGGRRCDTHLRALTAAELLPPRRPGLPAPKWASEAHQAPAQLYAELPHQIVNAALNSYLRAVHHQPEMTDQLSSAVSIRAGAHLAGLDHRLKSLASLARKITTNAYLLHRTPDQAAAALNDIIRYTVTARRARDLVPTLTAVVEQLSAQGWTVHTVKQSFIKGNPYKGIHLIMTGPAGQRCEIQFHTETALTIKEQTHGAYKIYRDLNMSAQQRIRAFERCISRWEDVPTPPGLPALTTLGGAAVVVTDYRPKRPPIPEEKQP